MQAWNSVIFRQYQLNLFWIFFVVYFWKSSLLSNISVWSLCVNFRSPGMQYEHWSKSTYFSIIIPKAVVSLNQQNNESIRNLKNLIYSDLTLIARIENSILSFNSELTQEKNVNDIASEVLPLPDIGPVQKPPILKEMVNTLTNFKSRCRYQVKHCLQTAIYNVSNSASHFSKIASNSSTFNSILFNSVLSTPFKIK